MTGSPATDDPLTLPLSASYDVQRTHTTIEFRVLERIAHRAALSVPGVIMHSSGISQFAGRRLPRVSVRMAPGGRAAVIDLLIAASWPAPTAAIAQVTRETVGEWVEQATGVPVVAVNVDVAAVVPAPDDSPAVTLEVLRDAPRTPLLTRVSATPLTAASPAGRRTMPAPYTPDPPERPAVTHPAPGDPDEVARPVAGRPVPVRHVTAERPTPPWHPTDPARGPVEHPVAPRPVTAYLPRTTRTPVTGPPPQYGLPVLSVVPTPRGPVLRNVPTPSGLPTRAVPTPQGLPVTIHPHPRRTRVTPVTVDRHPRITPTVPQEQRRRDEQ